ncbi:btb/poz domain-containing [Anaeramoeba flamelloides]|uniref:Btb/poz domain-containing n=1 Tax=Anaeramoeba flamelloides TaxID=1746091 RepID=A0AAV7YDC4_9EUKA|nr:btb/poz domain-containing [Anaeramoeba flamelloides]
MTIRTTEQLISPLVNGSELADVVFKIGEEGVQMFAHKLILSISNLFWKKLFYSQNSNRSNGNKIKVIRIPDIEPESFKPVLDFIYTRKAELKLDIIWSIFEVCDRFEMDEFRQFSLNFLENNLETNQLFHYYEKSLNDQHPEIRKRLIKLIEQNSQKIFSERNCLNNLQEETIFQILKSRKLQVKEFELVQRIKERAEFLITQKENNNIKKEKEKEKEIEKEKEKEEEEEEEQEQETEMEMKKGKTKEKEKKIVIKKQVKKIKLKNNAVIQNSNNNKKRMKCTFPKQTNSQDKNRNVKKKSDMRLQRKTFQYRDIRSCVGNLLEKIDLRLLSNIELDQLVKANLFTKEEIKQSLNQIKNRNQKKRDQRCKTKEDLKILFITNETKQARIENILESLRSSGIKSISVLHADKEIPFLKRLKKYDALFLFSAPRGNFKDPIWLGDEISKYVDDGGGIVICAYACLAERKIKSKFSYALDGGISDQAYLPMKKGPFFSGKNGKTRCDLGKVFLPNHPTISQVKCFDGGIHSHRINTEFVPGGVDSKMIAQWSDGNPLICYKRKLEPNGIVLVLNFNPVSERKFLGDKGGISGSWSILSNGNKILSNAIQFVAMN